MSKRTQSSSSAGLDLSSVPPIYIFPTHVATDDLHQYEDQVYAAGGALTYSPTEGRVFLGRISQKKRAAFELRSNGVWTEEAPVPVPHQHETRSQAGKYPEKKRRKLNEDSRAGSSSFTSSDEKTGLSPIEVTWPDLEAHIIVLKLDWLELCLKHNTVLPYGPHLVYSGKLVSKPPGESSSPFQSHQHRDLHKSQSRVHESQLISTPAWHLSYLPHPSPFQGCRSAQPQTHQTRPSQTPPCNNIGARKRVSSHFTVPAPSSPRLGHRPSLLLRMLPLHPSRPRQLIFHRPALRHQTLSHPHARRNRRTRLLYFNSKHICLPAPHNHRSRNHPPTRLQ